MFPSLYPLYLTTQKNNSVSHSNTIVLCDPSRVGPWKHLREAKNCFNKFYNKNHMFESNKTEIFYKILIKTLLIPGPI